MRYADRGRSLVDMLAARAGRSVGVDLQIRRINIDLDIVIKFGHDITGTERSLPFTLCIERGDTDQPVNSGFGFQQSVSILSFHLKGHTLDARFIAFLIVQQFDRKTMTLAPSRIHAVKHLVEIHRLGTAGTRRKRDRCIVGIILTGQKEGCAHVLYVLCETLQGFAGFFSQFLIILFTAHLDQRLDILILRLQ